MGDRTRYGIIGSGMMGLEHLRNLALIPDAEVTAIADPNAESRHWGRETAGQGVQLYEDHRDLLARAPVDALVIATPNHTHAAVLDDALQGDLPILVEKPLCTDLEDSLRITEAAERRSAIVWVGMQYRYMPPLARAIEEVRRGGVGLPVMIAIREHRFPFLRKVGDWNRFSRNTGGTLVEKCCHFFDLMRLIADARPTRVLASGGQDVNHLDEVYEGEVPDILDNAFVIVEFDGGCRASLDLCMFAEGSRHHEEIAITGDAGKIEFFLPESSVWIGRRATRRTERIDVPVEEEILRAGFHHGATYFQHLAFLDAVRRGEAPQVSARDGLWAVALGVAAERSVRERRPVGIEELGLGAAG